MSTCIYCQPAALGEGEPVCADHPTGAVREHQEHQQINAALHELIDQEPCEGKCAHRLPGNWSLKGVATAAGRAWAFKAAVADDPEGIVEAADTVEWRWSRYERASGVVDQADALVELSNAMSDLASWLPNYDPETGEVERE